MKKLLKGLLKFICIILTAVISAVGIYSIAFTINKKQREKHYVTARLIK